MQGRRNYKLIGTIKYVWDGDIETTFRFETNSNDVHNSTCPSEQTLHQRQSEGFRHLRDYSVQYLTSNKMQKRNPGAWLADEIGPRPPTPDQWTEENGGEKDTTRINKAWPAHHIVPKGTFWTKEAEALLFRACVHPNSAANGIYLRGHEFKKGNNNNWYPWLFGNYPLEALRHYHGDTLIKSPTSRYRVVLYANLAQDLDVEDQNRTWEYPCQTGSATAPGSKGHIQGRLGVLELALRTNQAKIGNN